MICLINLININFTKKMTMKTTTKNNEERIYKEEKFLILVSLFQISTWLSILVHRTAEKQIFDYF